MAKIPSTPSTPITPRTPGSGPPEVESPVSKKQRDFKASTSRRRATRTKSKPLEPLGENEVTNTDGFQSLLSTDRPTDREYFVFNLRLYIHKEGRLVIRSFIRDVVGWKKFTGVFFPKRLKSGNT